MNSCPFCGSGHITFNAVRGRYGCIDCWEMFDTPAETSEKRQVFFSYGHDENTVLVERIKAYLESRGFTVWMDKTGLREAQDWRREIVAGLQASDEVLVFLSRHAVRESGVCREEWRLALSVKHGVIKTVLLEPEEDVQIPSVLCNSQWLDLSDWKTKMKQGDEVFLPWFEEAMRRLCDCLENGETSRFGGEIEQLKAALRQTDSFGKEQRLMEKEMFGRTWLTEQLEAWCDDRDAEPVFLIFGTAGSGKSLFCARHMCLNYRTAAGLFFEWNMAQSYTPRRVIETLAFRLATRLADYRAFLLDYLAKCKKEKRDPENIPEEVLMEEMILSPLSLCIDGQRESVMVVFDGMDEIGEQGERLLLMLVTAIRKFPPWIKVVMTSRPDEKLVSLFGRSRQISLTDDPFGDLRHYLDERLGDTVSQSRRLELAQRCGGSFLYAEQLCEAILSGTLHPDDTKEMPIGMDGYYFMEFQRAFADTDFAQCREILELLSVEGAIPRALLRQVLQLDSYTYIDRMRPLKNLVVTVYPRNAALPRAGEQDTAVMEFHHKAMAEWLSDPLRADAYYVDVKAGQKRLAQHGMDVMDATMYDVERRENDSLYAYYYHRMPALLVGCGWYDNYARLLLDKETERRELWQTARFGRVYYNAYEAYDYSLWDRVSAFPEDYDMTLVHQAFHESFSLFGQLLSRAVYRCTRMYGAMFAMFIGQLHRDFVFDEFLYVLREVLNPLYLRSAASEEYPYNGLGGLFNLDKLRAAQRLDRLVTECETLGRCLQEDDRQRIENFRVSLLYCEGKPFCFDTVYLNYPSLFAGKINTYEPKTDQENWKNAREVRNTFNAYALFDHLVTADRPDDGYIRRLTAYGADRDRVRAIARENHGRLNTRQREAVERFLAEQE